MATLQRGAPTLSVRDLSGALAHYQRLGSTTREYDSSGCGYASAGVEIHVGPMCPMPPGWPSWLFGRAADGAWSHRRFGRISDAWAAVGGSDVRASERRTLRGWSVQCDGPGWKIGQPISVDHRSVFCVSRKLVR